MTASKIEWTGRSDWNPIRGCTRVSEGCGSARGGGCYAEAIAARFSDPGQAFHGFAKRTPAGPRWTGRVELVEDRLTLPLRWRKPATVFASSTSDFFHESLSDGDIDRLFAVMALAPQHTFQVLTKRSARMREYLAYPLRAGIIQTVIDNWEADDDCPFGDNPAPWSIDPWPLSNVWLGVSVEDQAAADARIPDLLATPAAVRFLSCEPLLGSIDLTTMTVGDGELDALRREDWSVEVENWRDSSETWEADFEDWYGRHPSDARGPMHPAVDWVIAGGESGRGARPMHPDWARGLRDQCADAGVPFFFKQHGEWIGVPDLRDLPGGTGPGFGAFDHCQHDMEHEAVRVGKGRAGRLLDGVTHNGMPGSR